MITQEAADVITGVFKNRWRTLMSVDDVIGSVIEACKKLGVDDNTYYFYSSGSYVCREVSVDATIAPCLTVGSSSVPAVLCISILPS